MNKESEIYDFIWLEKQDTHFHNRDNGCPVFFLCFFPFVTGAVVPSVGWYRQKRCEKNLKVPVQKRISQIRLIMRT